MTNTTSNNGTTTRAEFTVEQVTGSSTSATASPGVDGSITTATEGHARQRSDDEGLRIAALRDVGQGAKLTFADVRGFPVRTTAGKPVGSVSRILVDQAQANAPRYLDIQLDPTAIGSIEKIVPNVLIPIGRAQLSADAKVVQLPEISIDMLRTMPRRTEGALDWQHELALGKVFGLKAELLDRDALYSDDLFSVRYFQQLQKK